MNRKNFLLPTPASATQLLADFICSPVSMRPDRLFATVKDLFTTGALAGPSIEQRFARIDAARAALGDDDKDAPLPWECSYYDVKDGVATLYVKGALVKGYDDFTCWWYGLCSTDKLQASLTEIAARADIWAVKSLFNTPGGVSTGMPEAANQFVALGETKLTVGFTSDMAASNGCRLLVANEVKLATGSAIVGSIGTYIALYDYSEYLKELGIKLELFRDGSLKGIGLMGKELTDKEKAFLAETVATNGAIFKDFVRARCPDVTDETMQGQWFSGDQARERGLVDAVVASETEVDAYLHDQRPKGPFGF